MNFGNIKLYGELDATEGTVTGISASAIIQTCNGRLTLESGVPVSTTDQTAKTTLYFTPYNGNQIALYSGSAWAIHTLTEKSLDISGYTASKPYDIFIYDNSGTLTLEGVIWTNDTTRATALATQNGVYVQNGAANKRYIGTIRITATTGQCEDSATKRFVWNYYNREWRTGKTYNTTKSWTYETATIREYNGGTNQVRFEFVRGSTRSDYFIENNCTASGISSGSGYVGICANSTTGNNLGYHIFTVGGYITGMKKYTDYSFGVGYHYITQTEHGTTGMTVQGETTYGTRTIIKLLQ